MTNYTIDRGIPIAKDLIHPNPWNPNKTKQRQQEAIAESLETYGQVIELLVRPHPDIEGEFQVIDGEHRLTELADVVYCNILHDVSEADAKKLTIILNETRGTADKIELSQLLADISVEFEDNLINALPYSPDELEELVKLSDLNWEQFATEPPPDEANQQSSGDSEWKTILVKMPADAFDVLNQAADLVRDMRDTPLHKDTAIAWGQILEAIAADFLATN